MQYAINIEGKRIRPEYSGQVAYCDFCKEKLIGKCGKIYIWHWQHVNNANCDLWKEGETDWHRAWKNKFPNEWQEKIIDKDGEKHIADIFTSKGIVIEFQNSTISSSTIIERERFYKKMIWVINAQSFKDNLVTEDLSSKLILELDRKYSILRDSVRRYNFYEIQNFEDKQKKLKLEIESREHDLTEMNSLRDIYDRHYKNPETFADRVINIWQSDNLFIEPALIEITNDKAIASKKNFFKLLGELKRNKHFLKLAAENSLNSETISKERDELLTQLESLKPVLIEELKSVAPELSPNLQEEIVEFKKNIAFLKNEREENIKENQEIKIFTDNHIRKNLKNMELDYNDEKNKILKDKDKLSLIWKHERKSWASSTAPIFFDIGEDNLLYKYPDNRVILISTLDFLEKYNPKGS